MKSKAEESRFTRLYLWMGSAKINMGLFFVAFVLMYFLLGLICEGLRATLDVFYGD